MVVYILKFYEEEEQEVTRKLRKFNKGRKLWRRWDRCGG